jgi:polar amino acid transport system permease protein
MTASGILLLWPQGWSRERKSTATMAAAALLILTFLGTLGAMLSRVPEPIGPVAGVFAEGTRVTMELTVVASLAGLVIGVLTTMAQVSRIPPLRWLAGTYVWVFRGTPLLIQVFFIFSALSSLTDFSSAAVALALNVGAYNSVAIRGGLEAIPKGQTEAARSLGLSPLQTFFHVVFPQGIKIALPSLVNNVVSLLKDSSLAYTIGVLELANAGNRLSASTFQPRITYLATGAIYLVLTTLLTQISNAIEHRLDVEGRVA